MSGNIKTFTLKPGSELRFENETEKEIVLVELKSGNAEIFGTEIVTNKTYEFGYDAKAAIFTYHGCVINVSGNPFAYISEKTPMYEYLQAHTNLESLRHQAKKNNSRGPIVMIAGSSDVGKSTISKILLNYAVRSGWNPIHVNIDPGQGSSLSVPGTIGASIVDRAAPVGGDFCDEDPLVFHFGHISPTDNQEHFKTIVSGLAKTTLNALDCGTNKASGIIIDTFGNSQNTGFFSLLHAAKKFEVDTIFVVAGERLAYNLQRKLPSTVKIVNLFSSMGVVEKTVENRVELRRIKIKEYFYGNGNLEFYPHSINVKWDNLEIYKIGAPALPQTCLPIGMQILDHETRIVPVRPGPNLLYHILGVTFGEISDKDLLRTNIAGFVCVTDVDVDKQTVTFLSPYIKILPNAAYLMSEIKFID